ncbi:hypothetical protein [Burkholderia phage BCSR5]|nr:hypothetical protein [Burkholderia phage BCSR5]
MHTPSTPIENEFHARIAGLLTKREQGHVMGVLRAMRDEGKLDTTGTKLYTMDDMRKYADEFHQSRIAVSSEGYPKDFVRLDLMVAPDGTYHAIGGPRFEARPGMEGADLEFIGLRRLNDGLLKTRISIATEKVSNHGLAAMVDNNLESMEAIIEALDEKKLAGLSNYMKKLKDTLEKVKEFLDVLNFYKRS